MSLLVGLLVSTVAVVAGVAYVSTRNAIGELEATHFVLVSTAATREVETLLEPAHILLAESTTQANRDLLPVDRPDELGDYLVEHLRYRNELAWLSYSDDATGRFVGAWRRPDGAIILNHSVPDIDGGRPFEVLVGPDGLRSPFYREVKAGYDPRQKPWYQDAIASSGMVWTQPYEFNEGRLGITAALALRDEVTFQPRGVFTADFFLDDVSRFLAELLGGGQVRAFVLTRTGDTVASSSAAGARIEDPLLASALKALPESLATLEVGEPTSFMFEHDGVGYAAVFQVFNVAGELEWTTAVMAPEEAFVGVVHDNARFAASVGLLVLLIAVALGSFLASRVSAPLGVLASELEHVGRFELSRELAHRSSVKEIAVVSQAAERMKAGLRSFGRYVPRQLVRDVLASGTEAQLGGRLRDLTIHFSDIEGFTSISETMSPADLVHQLAEYLHAMTVTIEGQHGTIGKFLGDGILAFFNAPNDLPNHAALAVRAALNEQEQLRALQVRWAAEGRPIFRARIGLHLGEAVVGNIGTPDRFEYTVVGDAVNLASRLEGLNKTYSTTIIASQQVREAAGPDFEWRSLDRVAVLGRSGGTLVSELLGERGRVAPKVLLARDLYEQALEAYFQHRFDEAAAGFRAVLDALPGDRAAEIMLSRTETLQRQPLPASWDGVHLQVSK